MQKGFSMVGLFMSSLFILGCQENRVDFIIHNHSNSQIDTVTVTTSDFRATIEMRNIQPFKGRSGRLYMGDVIKKDGDYIVEIRSKTQRQSKHIGYYTNGWPCEEKIDIYVSNDTFTCKQTLNQY